MSARSRGQCPPWRIRTPTDFWKDLLRRRVARVAVFYIAGAWILAQAVDLLLDAFDASLPRFHNLVLEQGSLPLTLFERRLADAARVAMVGGATPENLKS
jgi:hypothetical protein